VGVDRSSDASIVLHAEWIRRSVFGIWTIVVIMTPYESYHFLPVELVSGHGIGRLVLDSSAIRLFLWQPPTLTILKWLAVSGCFCCAVSPRRFRTVIPIVVILILVLDSLTKSNN
jgi:hypothetical protein